MGSGAHLLVVGSEPPYEQGLREVVCYQRGVRLRGDGPDHGEALSSCLGFIKQFQKGSSRKLSRIRRAGAVRPRLSATGSELLESFLFYSCRTLSSSSRSNSRCRNPSTNTSSSGPPPQ